MTMYPTVRPSLTLDFQKSKQLDPRISFSRTQATGQATYVEGGVIKYADEHQARFEEEGLLVEEIRTNYIPNSTDFTGWAQLSGASIALSSAVTAPDGGTSSSLFTADDGTGYVKPPYTIPGSTTAYLTLFVKAASENVFKLNSSRSSTMRGLFDMTTGLWSSTAGSADDYTAKAYPNGWWKLTVKGFIAGTSTIVLYVSAPNITSAGTDAFYMWGCQIEHGSFPSSYIPTSGSALVRAPDVCTISSDNFSSWYNQSEGTMQVTFNVMNNSLNNERFLAAASSTSPTNTGYVYRVSTLYAVQNTGSNNWTSTGSWLTTGIIPGNNNFTFGYSPGSNATVRDGVIQETNTETVLVEQSSTTLYMLNQISGHISRLAFYSERLTDAQLKVLTS